MKLSAPDIEISKGLRKIADELDKKLTDTAGQKMLFSLVVFNSEPGSRMNYISNCERQHVYNALSLILKGWEQGMPDIKAHEIDG